MIRPGREDPGFTCSEIRMPLYRDRHHVLTVAVEDLFAIWCPKREIPALRRDRNEQPFGRVAFHVHIKAPRAVGGEGDPRPIWRDDGSKFVKLGYVEGFGRCALIQLKREYVKVTPLIPLHKGQYPLVRKIGVGEQHVLPFEKLLSLTPAIRGYPPYVSSPCSLVRKEESSTFRAAPNGAVSLKGRQWG